MPYRYRRLRQRCQLVIDRLPLSRPYSVGDLCDHLAQQRGRPLQLQPLPPEAAGAGCCGLWISTPAADHIFYEQRTARLHQDHIVLHELGHVLFDHRPQDMEDQGLAALLPDLDPHTVRGLLARTGYTTRQEQEAEMFASLVGISGGPPERVTADGVLGKLEASMGVRASK